MAVPSVVAIAIAALTLSFVDGQKWMAKEDWRPIASPISHIAHRFGTPALKRPFGNEQSFRSGNNECGVSKVSMNQELGPQFIQYTTSIPDMKEFTLCLWTKFHNHSGDHPLFSYSVAGNMKEISLWISNTKDASFFSMAVAGHTFFRLNYPLKLHQWYHSCQSWNGKTGEWQIWVNAERVGRGFHNRLVGHLIKGGGMAISGQDQAQIFGSDDGAAIGSQKKTRGLMGEITLVQLYHVALTAGKAHKDHKHHHALHFRHDGTPIETTPSPTQQPTTPPIPVGNGQFLIGNQIQRGTRLNIVNRPQTVPVQLPNGLQFRQQFANGQLSPRIVSEQLLTTAGQAQQQQQQQQQQRILPENLINTIGSTAPASFAQGDIFGGNLVIRGSLLTPSNAQFSDESSLNVHEIFKRSPRRDKRDNPEMEIISNLKRKRGLIALPNGSIIDDSLLLKANVEVKGTKLDEEAFAQSLVDGLAGFDGNQSIQDEQKEQVDEREPAEAEVKAVMDVCSSCDPEPFKKALVFAWKNVPMKIHGGGYYYKGLGICKAF